MYTNNFQLKIIPSRIYRLVIKSFSVAYGGVSRIIIPKITLALSNVLLQARMLTTISLRTRIIFIDSLVDIIGYIYLQLNVSKIPARISSRISEYGKILIDKIIPPPVGALPINHFSVTGRGIDYHSSLCRNTHMALLHYNISRHDFIIIGYSLVFSNTSPTA